MNPWIIALTHGSGQVEATVRCGMRASQNTHCDNGNILSTKIGWGYQFHQIGRTTSLTARIRVFMIKSGKRAALVRGVEPVVTGRNLITSVVLISLPIIGGASCAGGQYR